MTLPAASKRNSGSADSTSRLVAPRCSASAAATSRAASSGSATVLGSGDAAGEDRVELVVVEAGVGADPAAVEAGRARPRPRPQLDLRRHRQPLDPRRQAAGVAGERVRQHRLDRAGHVGAVGAPPRLEVERRARLHVGGDVGDVDPDAGAVALALGGDGVVEVARGGRVDGEGGERGEVAARARIALGGLRRPRSPRPRAPAGSRGSRAARAAAPRPPRARSAAARDRAAAPAPAAPRRGAAPSRRLAALILRPGRRAPPAPAAWPRRPRVCGSSATRDVGVDALALGQVDARRA